MALTFQPFAETPEIKILERKLHQNVNKPERIGSVIGGIGLALLGLRRGTLPGLIIAGLGGALIHRGVTGRCRVYDALDMNTKQSQSNSGVRGEKGHKVVRTVIVDRPRSEVYRTWRDFRNLPKFMRDVRAVHILDE